MKKLLWLFTSIFAVALTANAQLLLHENFDYPTGDSISTHGWSIHSGLGTTPILVGSTSLIYDGYLGSGTGKSANVFGTGEDMNKGFTEVTDDGASIYVSALLNVTESANNIAGVYLFRLGYRSSESS